MFMYNSQHLIPTGIFCVGGFFGFFGLLMSLPGELDTEYLCFSFHKQFRTYIDCKCLVVPCYAREKNTERTKAKMQEIEENESLTGRFKW